MNKFFKLDKNNQTYWITKKAAENVAITSFMYKAQFEFKVSKATF